MHETVARARFHIKFVKNCRAPLSSISHKNRKKTVGLGALLVHEVGKRCTVARARFHIQIVKH